jgi:hypothetical protein
MKHNKKQSADQEDKSQESPFDKVDNRSTLRQNMLGGGVDDRGTTPERNVEARKFDEGKEPLKFAGTQFLHVVHKDGAWILEPATKIPLQQEFDSEAEAVKEALAIASSTQCIVIVHEADGSTHAANL